MARPPDESISNAALRLLRRKHKATDFTVVGIDEDAAAGYPVYRVHAAPSGAPNAARETVILDRAGRAVDVDALSEREGRPLFERFDPVVTVKDVPRPVPAAAVTIQPAENILTLNPGDTVTETITVKIPKNGAAPKADVYFLADTTASMTSILNAVQVGANNILAALNGLGIDFFFGVGNYKDFPHDPYCLQHQQSLTNIAPAVTGAINAWSAAGGADGPEGQLFALDKVAEPPGGGIGWRAGAKRILMWFGDYPGHDPICAAISGQPAAITESSVTAKLANEGIAVLAISVLSPGLDADPAAGAVDYVALCGAPGGLPGQGTRIANATGGQFASGINAGTIVNTIIGLVTAAVSTISNVSLVPTGGTAQFVASISPAGGYGPLAGDREHTLTFEVVFKGVVPCRDEDQVFTGALEVVAEGKVVARKKVQITVPACPRRFVYSVKFLCGEQRDCSCECASVRPGIYATEINIHNYRDTEVAIEKFVTPVVFAGAAVGREPKVATRKAADRIVLPPHAATMDDCCRIAELLLGAKAPAPMPLTVGFLEISSPEELAVTAVYTVSDLGSGGVSIDVEQVDPVAMTRR